MYFDDILRIRKGGPEMLLGRGATVVEDATSVGEWETKAAALRRIYQCTLGRIPDNYAHSLDPETKGEEDCGDYVKRTVAYNVGPRERINAYLLIPKGRPFPRPAVLTLHPTTPVGKEQTIGNDPTPDGQDRAYGKHLVQRGYVTLSYDLLSANEREYPGSGSFGTEPFYKEFPEWSVRGKDLWDVSRAIDFLETVKEVDAARIGSIGHSQGAGITIDAMVVEPRIKAGVANCGDWPGRLYKNPFCRARTGWWIGQPFLRPLMLCGKDFPVDLHEKLALAAPRAIMMITALNDWDYTEAEESVTRPCLEALGTSVKRVFDLYGCPENFQSLLHMEGHSFKAHHRKTAFEFLDQHLYPER